jgi:hypothetical protein
MALMKKTDACIRCRCVYPVWDAWVGGWSVSDNICLHACLPHADGRCDGVADGHSHQVDVLGQRAEPVLANSCKNIIC